MDVNLIPFVAGENQTKVAGNRFASFCCQLWHVGAAESATIPVVIEIFASSGTH